MLEMCRSTFLDERKRTAPISRLLAPLATSRAICRWRGLRRSVGRSPRAVAGRVQVRNPSRRSACSASRCSVAAPAGHLVSTSPNVEEQTQSAELFFLPLATALARVAALLHFRT